MAAITTSNRQDHSLGNLRAVTVQSTTISDGDTWATGLTRVHHATVTVFGEASDPADGVAIGTNSSGTLTFRTTGTITGALIFAVGI